MLFAGLYFGARTFAGTGGAAAPAAAARGTVKLRVPGAAGYEPLTAAVDDSALVAASYAGFVDVTARVASAGAGTYTVADVQSGTGADRYAGWALVVAYEHPDEPARNLSVFDGLQTIRQGDPPVSIALSGFRTPPTGPVRTHVGFVAFEGDRGATGDAAALNGQPLSDAANPANNVFNSSISQFGAPFRAKAPDFANQLGFDADVFSADGVLANGATGATVQISTAQFFADQYSAQVLAFATELFAPRVDVTKAVANVSRPGQPARPGDVLRYTATFANIGGDAAVGLVATDAVPAGTAYEPGSLRILSGPNAPASPTDTAGDDAGEVAGDAVAVRLGTLPVDAVASLSFDVRVTTDAPAGGQIDNVIRAAFRGEALDAALNAESAPATIPVAPFGDLSLTKTATPDDPIAGQQLTYTIVVGNDGPSAATGVTVTDALPAGIDPALIRPTQGSCRREGRDLTCALGTLPAGGAAQIVVVADVARSRAGDRVENRASVAAAEFDPNAANDADDVTVTVRPPATPRRADLTVRKTADRQEVSIGSLLTYTIRVRNDGPADATGVELTDTLGGPVDVVEVDPGQGSCDPGVAIRCRLGRIPAGDAAAIELRVRPLAAGTLANGVSVAGARVDPAPRGNVHVIRTRVLPRSDRARVRLTKMASRTVARLGGKVRYRIVLRSLGPDPARALRVCDRLPRGLVLVGAPGARVRGGVPCWRVARLGPDRKRTFTVTARAVRTTTNTADVRGVNVRAARARANVRVTAEPRACAATAAAC